MDAACVTDPLAGASTGGTGAGAGGTADAAANGGRILESVGNNSLGSNRGRLVVVPCRCRRRVCRTCAPGLGFRFRRRVRELVAERGLFRRPKLLTLTVALGGDGGGIHLKHFPSAEAAYDHINGRGLVSALMSRVLGCAVWLWVVEFNSSGSRGNGNLHWHVLYDEAACPGGRLDFRRLVGFWFQRWGIGIARVSDKGGQFRSALHAVHYITKYLVKYPEEGFPEWVWEKHSVRFVGASALVGRLVSASGNVGECGETDGDEVDEVDACSELERRRCVRRSNREAVSRCGGACSIYREVLVSDEAARGGPATRGGPRAEWAHVGSLPGSYDSVFRAVDVGAFGKGARVVGRADVFGRLKGWVLEVDGCYSAQDIERWWDWLQRDWERRVSLPYHLKEEKIDRCRNERYPGAPRLSALVQASLSPGSGGFVVEFGKSPVVRPLG